MPLGPMKGRQVQLTNGDAIAPSAKHWNVLLVHTIMLITILDCDVSICRTHTVAAFVRLIALMMVSTASDCGCLGLWGCLWGRRGDAQGDERSEEKSKFHIYCCENIIVPG